MEEVSGLNLNPFFQQWLYKPGTLELDGQWFYDKQNKELVLEMNQIQKGGGLIQMTIEIGIDFLNHTKIVKIQLKDKQCVYKIKVDQKPLKIILDPNLWVLMNSNFELPYQSKK